VTQADLHYEGSVSIDQMLLRQADILPYEEVHIWNVSRGTRLTTYAMLAPPGSWRS
jgi:aspartate 1-decarboxylase